MKYIYNARTQAGKIETGTIEAHSKESAAALLQKYNIFPTSLQEQEGGGFSFKTRIERKVSRKDLSVFFRQMAVMLESRVPVAQSLDGLAAQTKKENFRKVITEISGLVQEGIPLSEAFSRYPKIFSNFYVNLVKSGEASGNIAGTLDYISEHAEKENDIVAQVRQAMIYPIFVVLVLFVVIGIIVVEIVPKIVELIKETNQKPSAFTSAMLGFFGFIADYWWLILIAVALSVSLIVFYFHTKEGKKNYAVLTLKAPFLGNFLKKIFLARLCGNISTLISAGISINKALAISEDTVNNIVYKNIIAEIGKDVSEGEKISSSMAKYQDYFPIFVIQMIRVGEETGKLNQTMKEVVNFYQKEIKRAIDLFTSMLEPIMIIFLGVIVAMLAVSVLSPLYESLGNI